MVAVGGLTGITDGPRVADTGNDHALFRVLRRGATGAFLVQVGGAGLGLLVYVVIARKLGAIAYGRYALALSWIGLLTIPALLGLQTAVVRLLPRYHGAKDWAESRGLRRGATVMVLGSGVVISMVGAALIHFVFRRKLGQDLELTLLAGFALLPVLALLQLNGAFHQGLKRAASAGAFVGLVRPIVLLALIFGAASVFRGQLTAQTAMLASAAAALVALVCSDRLLKRVWPPEARRVKPRYDPRSWLVLGGRLFSLTAIGVVLNRADLLVLGGIAGVAQVGPYFAAVQLAGLAAYGLKAVNTILAPMVAERYAAGTRTALASLVRYSVWIIFPVTVAVSIVVAVLGRWVLDLFGPGFATAYVPLLIILGGQCVNAMVGPVGTLMTMTRFERQAPMILGGGAALNLLLSVLLVPLFGMVGAAVATAAATVGWNAVALQLVRSKLGINPTVLPLPGV